MAITQNIRDATVMHICRYLRGRGHPDHPRLDGIVTDDMREAVVEDKTYRLRSFLLLMSGSPMLPASESQKLEVRHHSHVLILCHFTYSSKDIVLQLAY